MIICEEKKNFGKLKEMKNFSLLKKIFMKKIY